MGRKKEEDECTDSGFGGMEGGACPLFEWLPSLNPLVAAGELQHRTHGGLFGRRTDADKFLSKSPVRRI